jgi:hypothetical protein
MAENRTMRRLRVGGVLGALALAGTIALSPVALAQNNQIQVEIITPGAPGTPAAYGSLASPVTGLSTVATYAPDQWSGAAMVSETASYGRVAAALYAQKTGLGTGTIYIGLSDPPTEDAILTLVGMDDDAPAKSQIELTINQTVVYTGDSWFENWGGTPGEGNWTTVQITIPKGLLGPGVNSISVSNNAVDGNEGEAPYVLLGGASIQVTGASVAPAPRT